jgi:uncharacterized membrane protein YphA (DoxX/SURF4 family)
MNLRGKTFQRVDIIVTGWMASKALILLRMSIGIVFFWFGFLKFFDGMSPAEGIATRTIDVLTFHLLSEKTILIGLAIWETLIGAGLIFNLFMRETLLLLFLQMLGTFTPFFLFTNELFHVFPFSLTLEGQYIIKNLVIVSAGIALGATVRGGNLYPEHLEKTTNN